MDISFDKYSEKYDAWFLENQNILQSELMLLALTLQEAGKDILSVGCGTGIFEQLLKKNYDIDVKYGVEPAEAMANIARERGMDVTLCDAELCDMGTEKYDAIYFNGSSSYIKDLKSAYTIAYKALKPGGELILLDVPKENGYALLYKVAALLGSWDHEYLKDIRPEHPYPLEFVKDAIWHSTEEKTAVLEEIGFSHFSYAQTLTTNPKCSNDAIEEPLEGYDSGNYIAIIGLK